MFPMRDKEIIPRIEKNFFMLMCAIQMMVRH